MVEEMRTGYAGDYLSCLANLETIARHYCGCPVRVAFRYFDLYAGMASHPAGKGPLIEINPSIDAKQLGSVFFHEAVHHIKKHVREANTFALPHNAIAELPDGDTKDILVVLFNDLEREADGLSATLLGDFEARFGPFLEAIGGVKAVSKPPDDATSWAATSGY